MDIFTVNDEMVSEFKHKQYLYVQRSHGHLSKSRSIWKRADSGCTAASVYKAGHEYCCLAVCSEPFFKKTGQCGQVPTSVIPSSSQGITFAMVLQIISSSSTISNFSIAIPFFYSCIFIFNCFFLVVLQFFVKLQEGKSEQWHTLPQLVRLLHWSISSHILCRRTE